MAVKILAPRFGRLSYHYSKAIHLDGFSGDFLVGTAHEYFWLKKSSSHIPTAIMTNWGLHFLGRIFQIFEFGANAEGMEELRERIGDIPDLKQILSSTDIETFLNMLQEWDKLPMDKSLMSAYSRVFGQEWLFFDVKKEFVQNAIKAFSPSAGKESLLWPMLETLLKGLSWHWNKAFLIFESRYIQATTLGLPLEISKYYSTITSITLNAKLGVNPPLKDRLAQLLTSDVSFENDGFFGFVRDLYVFHGINTNLFQCGSELRSKNVAAMPWIFSTKMNIKEKKFELEIPFCQKETEILVAMFNTYAVSRNIEDLGLAKITPVIPEIVESDTYKQKSTACAEAKIYGAALCVESELKRAHFTEEYPLSVFLGYTHLVYKIQPADFTNEILYPAGVVHGWSKNMGSNPAGKIRIEINGGPHKHPVNVRELLETLRRLSKEATRELSPSDSSSSRRSHQEKPITTKAWKAAPEPVFSVKALAVGGAAKPEGYAADVYYTPAAQMDNTQLIVSQVGEESNWMMCADANVDKTHGEAKVHLRWGVECQSYEMTMKAAGTAHLPGSKPTLKAKMHWANVPEYMKEFGESVKDSIPELAFNLGFYQKNDKNTKQEVSASLMVVSADSIDMKIKLPELTVYRQTIPIPLQITDFQDGFIGNTTLDMHKEL